MSQMTVYSPSISIYTSIFVYFFIFIGPTLPDIDSRTNNNDINITVCQAWYCSLSSFSTS